MPLRPKSLVVSGVKVGTEVHEDGKISLDKLEGLLKLEEALGVIREGGMLSRMCVESDVEEVNSRFSHFGESRRRKIHR